MMARQYSASRRIDEGGLMDERDTNPGGYTPPQQTAPPKKKHTALGCGCLSLVAVIVVVFLVIAVNTGNKALSGSPAGATDAATVAAPVAGTAVSPAQMLDDLDGDKNPVADYQAALDALAPKCTQDAVHIAGLGDAGYQDLVKNGITDETRLTVLQHLDQSIPASIGKTDCAGMLSGYLVLRENG
jgi:hypothetical protein